MSDQSKENNTGVKDVPEWLKVIQINSWEAELLISALLLYMLFQVPGYLETYQKQHFSSGIFNAIFTVLGTSLKVLRIGYMLHIISRGIWVASVGLSYIYPKSLDLDKLGLKGKFAEELEDDVSLEKTIKRLEKFASLSYAISFMLSGMTLSIGLTVIYLIAFSKWLFVPAIESNSPLMKVFVFMLMFLLFALILIVFIDFVTNGVLRREKSVAKIYYYPAMIVRYLTLSFLYNRIQLSITSNLPRWQRHLVPILAALLIVGYAYAENKIDDWQNEEYLKEVGEISHRANFESLRKPSDPLYVTIQKEVIEKPVLELFLSTHGIIGRLYQKEDDISTAWNKLEVEERLSYVNHLLTFTVDSKEIRPKWRLSKHTVEYKNGYKSFVDITNLKTGLHTLSVSLDTVKMNPLQKRLVKENEPHFVNMALIDFYTVF